MGHRAGNLFSNDSGKVFYRILIFLQVWDYFKENIVRGKSLVERCYRITLPSCVMFGIYICATLQPPPASYDMVAGPAIWGINPPFSGTGKTSNGACSLGLQNTVWVFLKFLFLERRLGHLWMSYNFFRSQNESLSTPLRRCRGETEEDEEI